MEINACQLWLMGPPHSLVMSYSSGWWEMMEWALVAELFTNLEKSRIHLKLCIPLRK
jgi:hypothetical protein